MFKGSIEKKRNLSESLRRCGSGRRERAGARGFMETKTAPNFKEEMVGITSTAEIR